MPGVVGNQAFLRFSTACGILGPVLFALCVFLIGLLTPGYSQATQLMSELGETGAPYAPAMNLTGFLLTGLLLLLFSPGLSAILPPGAPGRAGSILVGIAGLTYIGEAIFPCDRGCIPVTFAGTVHLLIGEIAILTAVLASLLLAAAMKPDPRWAGYWQYSVATGVLVILLLPLFSLFPGAPGAVQRLVVGVILLWQFLVAVKAHGMVGKDHA